MKNNLDYIFVHSCFLNKQLPIALIHNLYVQPNIILIRTHMIIFLKPSGIKYHTKTTLQYFLGVWNGIFYLGKLRLFQYSHNCVSIKAIRFMVRFELYIKLSFDGCSDVDSVDGGSYQWNHRARQYRLNARLHAISINAQFPHNCFIQLYNHFDNYHWTTC